MCVCVGGECGGGGGGGISPYELKGELSMGPDASRVTLPGTDLHLCATRLLSHTFMNFAGGAMNTKRVDLRIQSPPSRRKKDKSFQKPPETDV